MINKIAAGEVIERPANIVKELVENSLDAGAKRVEIVIEKNGIDLIRIVDDGCGIDREQVRLALSAHATSKIAEADDLFKISTLGFRGEALASIAEVTQLIMRTRTENSAEGTEIRSEGGVFSEPVPCGMSRGTILEIRNLFFNIPARRKFLKSGTTEFGHIAEIVNRMALSHPDVYFLFQHNNRTVQDLPPVTDLTLRIKKLFGAETGDRLIYVENQRGDVRISGYVGHPDNNRPNTNFQYLFLNGRFIRDKSLQHALQEAYRGLLPVGRYPVAFINIEVPPDFVDVNVHPMKLEVRFVNSSVVYSGFLGAIREQFLRSDLKSKPHWEKDDSDQETVMLQASPVSEGGPEFSGGDQEYRPDDRDPRAALDPNATEDMRNKILQWAKGDLQQADETNDSPFSDRSSSDGSSLSVHTVPPTGGGLRGNTFSPCGGNSGGAGGSGGSRSSLSGLFGDKSVPDFIPYPESSTSRLNLHRLPAAEDDGASERPKTFNEVFERAAQAERQAMAEEFGESPTDIPPAQPPVASRLYLQIHQRYIVMETEKGLAVIDQHALHERILYERIKAGINAGRLESQKLLIPVPVDLSPVEMACALENRDLLAEFGLIVDSFGGNTVLISGYPAMIHHLTADEILLTLIAPLMESGKKPERTDLLDGMMHQMSCKAAVKAGEKITDESMAELIAMAEAEINSHHCPHGRPSTLVFTCEELDKMFKRT